MDGRRTGRSSSKAALDPRSLRSARVLPVKTFCTFLRGLSLSSHCRRPARIAVDSNRGMGGCVHGTITSQTAANVTSPRAHVAKPRPLATASLNATRANGVPRGREWLHLPDRGRATASPTSRRRCRLPPHPLHCPAAPACQLFSRRLAGSGGRLDGDGSWRNEPF